MRIFITLLLALCIFVSTFTPNEKIDLKLLNELSLHASRADFIIHMKEVVDLKRIMDNEGNMLSTITDYDEKARLIVAHLMKVASVTQEPIIRILKARNVNYTSIWITNSIIVENAPEDLVYEMAERADVERIVSNHRVEVDFPARHETFTVTSTSNVTIEPNLIHIGATELWKEGIMGQGIVSAVADTGVQYLHETLVQNYRGYLGNGKFDHNYNWFDGTRSTSTAPYDDDGHGSHVQSTAAGGFTKSRIVGIAPKAKWIACKALGFSSGGILKCLQFFLAPTDLKGQNPNPDLRPHVTSHSYFCSECRVEDAINALHEAGVVFIKSAGNRGPSCRSITEPGHYDNAIAIGALAKESDEIATFSSRGPTIDGKLKPDFAAPGSSIVAANVGQSNRDYVAMSGTSMAAPHMNGAITLLWSAIPELRRNIPKTIEIFQKTALHQTSTDCDSNGGSPNNVFGYGTINVHKAYKLAKQMYGKN